MSARPGGVAARRRDRPGLRPGPGRRRRCAGGRLACGRPLPNSHADWLGWPGPARLGQPCVSKGLRNFVVCQKLAYMITYDAGPGSSVQTRSYDGPSEYPALVHWRCHAADSWQKRPCLGHNLMLPQYELEREMQKSMRKLEMSRNLKRKTSDDTN